MITATQEIILLNRRPDPERRTDLYFPTRISGVSFHHKRQSDRDTGFRDSQETYRIRIPLSAQVQDGKTYLPESAFDRLSDADAHRHWTLKNGDLLIVCAEPLADVNTPATAADSLTMQEAQELAASVGLYQELIHVVDYADNTLRGSPATRHWRIGGG